MSAEDAVLQGVALLEGLAKAAPAVFQALQAFRNGHVAAQRLHDFLDEPTRIETLYDEMVRHGLVRESEPPR